ncbi:MAG: hypothetical protein WC840_02735 [Candidatus Peribacteraceae bacterium]
MDKLFLSMQLVPHWMWWPAGMCFVASFVSCFAMLSSYKRGQRLRREAKAFALNHGARDLTDEIGAPVEFLNIRTLVLDALWMSGEPANPKDSNLTDEYYELLVRLDASQYDNRMSYREAIVWMIAGCALALLPIGNAIFNAVWL